MSTRDITERARMDAELRTTATALKHRTRQLEAIWGLTAELARELDVPALLARITQHAVALVGAQSGSVYLWDAGDGVLVPQTWPGLGDWYRDIRHRLGEGVAGTVAQTRASLIVNDYRASPYATPFLLERSTITAAMGEPLVCGDRLVGALVVRRLGTGAPFTEDDHTLLTLFAVQAALILENAQLFTERTRVAGETRSLYEVAHSLTTSLDADEVLHLIALKTTELLGTPHAQVVLWDEATHSLRLGAACGTESADVQMQVFRLGSGVNGLVAETRAPLVVNDYQAFPHRVPGMTRVMAVIGVPLLYRNRFLGVLTSHATAAGWTFTDDHLALLTSFADQAAVALENARLFQAEQQRREELEATRAVTEEIARELDLTTLLRLINTRAVDLAHADHGAIYLWDKATQLLTPRSWYGLGEWMAELRMQPGEGVAGTVAAERQGMILNDFRTSRYATPAWLENTSHVAVLAEPLLYRTSLVGVITVNRNDPARPFRAEDQRRLRLFATQAAIAIANARLYEALRGAAAELEARVEARTDELKEANRRLETASQHKSEFLANMSHELRTPLNSILGFSQVLLERTAGRLAPKERRFLTHIQTSGQHLLQLINDILDLSKVEAGRLVLHPELVAIPKLVEETLVIVRGLANKKELRLEAMLPPDLPHLVVDPVRLKQILFNLLSNAVKFTPERGQVGVQVARTGAGPPDRGGDTSSVPAPAAGNDATGDWLELRVTDTGVGILAEDLPRLFQDFVQLEATATKRHEGTGLGLALTKQLVTLHGGRIWAESEGAGCGATFVVQLPFLEVASPRILVVEDEAPFRKLLAMILGGAGYRVQVAEDAAEAVRAVEADPPALVVLDVGLPPDGAGGWTVLAHMRSAADLYAVPVLIVTGQDQIRAEEALARGASDFLGKPVSADVLEQTVARLLARAGRPGDAAGPPPPAQA